MPPRVITFVTGNAKKLAEVQAILAAAAGAAAPGAPAPSFTLASAALDLPELQGSPEAVASAKALAAAALVAGPVVTEDTSLCFAALGGLPGVYVRHFLEAVGPAGLSRMLDGFEDKAAVAQCIFAYCAGPGAPPRLFVGRTPGAVVRPRAPQGADAFGWDPVFLPDGHAATYAEMDKAVKNGISHRYKALTALAEWLAANPDA